MQSQVSGLVNTYGALLQYCISVYSRRHISCHWHAGPRKTRGLCNGWTGQTLDRRAVVGCGGDEVRDGAGLTVQRLFLGR